MRVSNGSATGCSGSIAEPNEGAESPGQREGDVLVGTDTSAWQTDHEPGSFSRTGTAGTPRRGVEP